MKMCTKRLIPKISNQLLSDSEDFRKMNRPTSASKTVATRLKMMECVNPRCAMMSCVSFNQKVVMKSMSGVLCATAPTSNAFLPSFFPAMASPMQAPRTMWVKESNS